MQSLSADAGGTACIVGETFLRYTTDYRYISAQNGRLHRARAMLPKAHPRLPPTDPAEIGKELPEQVKVMGAPKIQIS